MPQVGCARLEVLRPTHTPMNMTEAEGPGADVDAMWRAASSLLLADFECQHGYLEADVRTEDCDCWPE